MAKLKRIEPTEEETDRAWLAELSNAEFLAHLEFALEEIQTRFGAAADEYRRREGGGVPRDAVIQTMQATKQCPCAAYRAAVGRGEL